MGRWRAASAWPLLLAGGLTLPAGCQLIRPSLAPLLLDAAVEDVGMTDVQVDDAPAPDRDALPRDAEPGDVRDVDATEHPLDVGVDAPMDAPIDAPPDSPSDAALDVEPDSGPCQPRAEVCDGIDNDCNPDTADGASDPDLGMPCDGADRDQCIEGGVLECRGSMLVCSDVSDDTVDVCDGVDNDCNGIIDDAANRCGFDCRPVTFGSSVYLFCRAGRDWPDARDACASLSGYALVTIDSAEENAFLTSEIAAVGNCWIGLNDRRDEGTWEWAGPNSGYRSWGSGEPNNGTLGEDCVELRTSGTWNDHGCGNNKAFICEHLL